MSFLIKKKG